MVQPWDPGRGRLFVEAAPELAGQDTHLALSKSQYIQPEHMTKAGIVRLIGYEERWRAYNEAG
jgi:hypothetical protein